MAGPLPRVLSRWVLVLLGGQLALGLAYAAAELGELPHYHDSNAYFELARILRVDAHRGIAYPAFLAAADRLGGAPSFLRVVANQHAGPPCTAPDGIALVQLLQMLLSAAAYVNSQRSQAAVSPSTSSLGWAGSLAVASLLVVDPLVAHSALSIMPDALAMAASLVFCGALARVAIGGQRPTRDGTWLFLAFSLASLLRPEKKYVLLCVAAASAAVWLWIAHRGLHTFVRLPARLAFAGGLVVLGLAASVTTERLVFSDYGRPGHGSVMLHARVIFPHLGDIFGGLPADVQRRFTESDIAFYDEHVLNPGPVMERVSGGNAAEAEQLTDQMARAAWSQRGPAIVFDTLKDGIENALPTLGFYPRMLTLEVLDRQGYRKLSRSDMLPWTHERMTEHHPELAHASLALSGIVFTLLAAAALVRWRRESRPAGGAVASALLPWIPAIAFALANGAAFALHADAVSPRYTVTTHVMCLSAVYASALATARSIRPWRGCA